MYISFSQKFLIWAKYCASMGFSVQGLDKRVAKSFAGRWFRLEGSGHPLERPGSRFSTELRAGTVTAAAMLYVSQKLLARSEANS